MIDVNLDYGYMEMWVSSLCDWEYIGAINEDTEIRRKNRFGGRWYKLALELY